MPGITVRCLSVCPPHPCACDGNRRRMARLGRCSRGQSCWGWGPRPQPCRHRRGLHKGPEGVAWREWRWRTTCTVPVCMHLSCLVTSAQGHATTMPGASEQQEHQLSWESPGRASARLPNPNAQQRTPLPFALISQSTKQECKVHSSRCQRASPALAGLRHLRDWPAMRCSMHVKTPSAAISHHVGLPREAPGRRGSLAKTAELTQSAALGTASGAVLNRNTM